ncbi:hypothetical protein BGZ63DRAFT_410645 [Mariannaea sp. PMI_226]|nr:hypothetical protein BGZ63DRAFT_410645 [Mariannaea sp. PMI_226]
MAPSATFDAPSSTSSGRPRILVPEKVSQDGLALLTPHFDVDNRPGISATELIAIIPQYNGLIVRSETQVTADVLQAGRKLRVVARAGVGVDNIDVSAATTQGIIVVNSPSGNIVAAAEHTIALLLATARNLGRADGSVKAGLWERSKLVGVEVGRKTLGIIGLGKVGMNVARMAKGLGMDVVAVDPYASADMAHQAGVKLVPGLQDILPVIDFLTIHTPLLATTLDLVGEEELKKMKKTARVLNVARGGVYNEAALLKALNEGWIAGAGLDVWTSEPLQVDSVAAQLSKHPKVVATPHLGASTIEAQENVSMDVCKQVLQILQGGLPTSAVNAPIILPEEYRKLQPSVKLVEKMGRLYTQHFVQSKGATMGGRRFELIYHGDLAGMGNTKPLYAALVKGLVSSFSDSHVNIVNAALIAKEKGLVISETHSRQAQQPTFANLVTLRSYNDGVGAPRSEQVIEGYASDENVYISKLGRFNGAFIPEGTLIILHNYDEPGKIGGVGMVLGAHGINIKFMQVASLDMQQQELAAAAAIVDGPLDRPRGNEALMILGVLGSVSNDVVEGLRNSEGVLDVNWYVGMDVVESARSSWSMISVHLRRAASTSTSCAVPPESFLHSHPLNWAVVLLPNHPPARVAKYSRPTQSKAALRPAVLGIGRVIGTGLSAAAAHPLSKRDGHSHEPGHESGASLWVLLVASMTLVLLGGAFAGLTIALMGQDSIYLQVLSGDASEPQHRNAKRVLQLLNRGKHWVLVTLLLSNVVVNESLPVVLDRTLGGGVAAVVGSTVLIVIFGEIVPQSVCVRYGLPIGGYMSKPVLALMYLTGPISYPIAKLLDWILGEDHGTVYKKSGLKTLVTLHKSLGELSERLNQDEVTIITAVLDLKDKPVAEVMTPMADVYTLAEDHILDEKTMDDILSSGYSRIPIYRSGSPNDFVGMLLVKTLITYDPEDRIPVRDVPLGAIVETRPETSCLDIINFFQEGKSHMVLVSEHPGLDHGALGVVTLEDVIEELIGEEIVDESDVYVDVHKAIRRLNPAPRARRSAHIEAPITAAVESRLANESAVLVEITPEAPHDVEVGSYHSNYEGGFHRAAKTAIHMKRRTSDGGIEGPPVLVKANLDDMRQHLRLGPANRAANPLSNRRESVFKIKQGLDTSKDVARPNLSPRPASHLGLLSRHADVESVNENTPLIAKIQQATKNGDRNGGVKTNGNKSGET